MPLPERTDGYQRKAQTVVGLNGFYTGQSGNLAQPNPGRAVILESLAMGHQGGNLLRARLVNPGAPNAPLSVVDERHGPHGEPRHERRPGATTSTAAQIVAAINADPAASALLRAFTYRGNAGAGVALPAVDGAADPDTEPDFSQLSDFLNAPAHVQRGPFQMRALRIGKQRDGSKVGVFIYCQQHAREWVTPITCLETGERLVRNYATDPQTKELVDNLDIFIVPSINPDGAHASLYDNQIQRKNLINRCAPNTFQDPLARNAVGTDLNRNNTIGSLFDGYDGASTELHERDRTPARSRRPSRRSATSSGSRTRSRTSSSRSTSTRTAATSCGRRARTSQQGRVTLPAPNIGIERYFFDVADTILSRIKESRNTVIPPNRTGPIADVLYSAAGNSADDQYYRRGIISYSFEAGAQRTSFDDQGRMRVTDVGFFPPFETEGKFQAMEFSDGNYGLLEGALEYAQGRHGAGDEHRVQRGEGRRAADLLAVQLAGRGGADPLHDRRLDADPGLAEVREPGPAPSRPGVHDRPARRPHRQVDRRRHQGQRLGRADADVPDRPRHHGERHRAGDAVADARHRRPRSARSRRASTATTRRR